MAVAAGLAILGAPSRAAGPGRVGLGTGRAAPGAGRSPAVQVVMTTAGLAERLTPQPPVRFAARVAPAARVIRVDDHLLYQRIEGFGAAMTDSSAWLLRTRLTPARYRFVMGQLFSTRGIGISEVRVPIAASDFTAGGVPYSYDDVPAGEDDPSLAHFSIGHDLPYVLPALRDARRLAPSLRLIANPWSAPAWMKSNGAMSNPNNTGRLRPDAFGPFAQYFVRFLQAYAAAGVPIDALTPENEPSNSALYPGMNFPFADEQRFLSGFLLPALRAAGVAPKVYGFDWGWDRIAWGVERLISDPGLAPALGLAWHCYAGNVTAMRAMQDRHPGLDQIVTECSSGIAPGPPGELLIAATRNSATTVLLWNIALNGHHGPVEPPNSGCRPCTGLIEVDERTGRVTYGRDYYQLGQVSRYVRPGARRAASDTFVRYRDTYLFSRGNWATADLDDVAFVNPDGTRVLVVYNNAPAARRFVVQWHARAFTYDMPAGAMVTFTWHP